MRTTKTSVIFFFLVLSSVCLMAKGNTPPASEPTEQPTNLVFPMVNTYSIVMNFTAPADVPDGYLIVRSVSEAPTGVPVDGATYSLDAVLGNGNVAYVGSSTSTTDFLYINGEVAFYAIYAYNGSGADINYLTVNPLSGSQRVGDPSGDYFSRNSGDWHDPSNWSQVSHTGPPCDTSPSATGGDVFVKDGHQMYANEDVNIVAMQLFVGTGAVINLNG